MKNLVLRQLVHNVLKKYKKKYYTLNKLLNSIDEYIKQIVEELYEEESNVRYALYRNQESNIIHIKSTKNYEFECSHRKTEKYKKISRYYSEREIKIIASCIDKYELSDGEVVDICGNCIRQLYGDNG